jgi:hypothetical protein
MPLTKYLKCVENTVHLIGAASDSRAKSIYELIRDSNLEESLQVGALSRCTY